MRRALVFVLAALVAAPLTAQVKPGPTVLPQGVARGGLAARAGGIRLNPKAKAEMERDAPPRSGASVLKGGKMRTFKNRPKTSPRKKAPSTPGRAPRRP